MSSDLDASGHFRGCKLYGCDVTGCRDAREERSRAAGLVLDLRRRQEPVERPPVEHYIRCSVTVGDLVVEPGLELLLGDDFPSLGEQLASLALAIGAMASHTADRRAACNSFEAVFEARWPGRAWFVELHDAKLERWTQSYQPYGIPRSR